MTGAAIFFITLLLSSVAAFAPSSTSSSSAQQASSRNRDHRDVLTVASMSTVEEIEATPDSSEAAFAAAVAAVSDVPLVGEVEGMPSFLQAFEHGTSSRLPYSPTGYSTWKWRTHHNPHNQLQQQLKQKQQRQQQELTEQHEEASQHYVEHSINYLEMGDPSKPALLLIHGFGASSYHFRHNIPVLARKYHVYAVDLLGFGWSDKPIMDYDACVWRDQVVDFVTKVILAASGNNSNDKPITIAGNSLGGYTAMYSASDARIRNYVKGCILLNAAGRFRDPESDAIESSRPTPNPIVQSLTSTIQRLIIAASFIYTKQPSRIEQILRSVYPVNNINVDSELIESIQTPSLDANAAEVFYRVITKNGKGDQAYVDDILKELECPLLLAWGEDDPWIRPVAADKIEVLYNRYNAVDGEMGVGRNGENGDKWVRRVSIAAGHCPHDESPEEVNEAILKFVEDVLGA